MIFRRENILTSYLRHHDIYWTTCISMLRLQIIFQVEMLRDCVRRECEERYELTEALAEARTELLSLQRFQDTKRTKSNHIPAPPTMTRKTPNSNIPGETKLSNTSITLKNISICNRTTLDSIHSRAGSEHGSTGSKEWLDAAVGKHSRNKLKLSFRNHRTWSINIVITYPLATSSSFFYLLENTSLLSSLFSVALLMRIILCWNKANFGASWPKWPYPLLTIPT